LKLSMWIINDWLRKHDPVAMIKDGELNIEKAGLFPNETLDDDSTVYIGRLDDFSNICDQIIISNRRDIICIHNCELEEILNEVNNAFYYYNSWELKLFSESQKDNPEQRIIDACEEMFGPMVLLDMELKLIAMSKNYPKGTVNEFWDSFLENGSLLLEQMKVVRSFWGLQHYTERFHCRVKQNNIAPDYTYNTIISYVNEENKLLGQLVIFSQTPPAKSECQLARTVEKAFSYIKNKKSSIGDNEYISVIFSNLLKNSDVNHHYEETLFLLSSWERQDKITIAVFQNLFNDKTLPGYLSKIKILLPACIITASDQTVTCCINETQTHNIADQVNKIVDSLSLRCGISNTYTGLQNIYIQGRQASDALKCGRGKSVSYFSEFSFKILLRNLDDKLYRSFCIHPALDTLRTYDKNHNTQLFETLRVFLQCERGYLAASKVLGFHRNTIIDRIQKIQDILCLDLNSSDEREYLLLSYRLSDDLNE